MTVRRALATTLATPSRTLLTLSRLGSGRHSTLDCSSAGTQCPCRRTRSTLTLTQCSRTTPWPRSWRTTPLTLRARGGSPPATLSQAHGTSTTDTPLRTIMAGPGYWVHSTSFDDQEISLAGPIEPGSGQAPRVEAIPTGAGWNFIGVIDTTRDNTQGSSGASWYGLTAPR